MDLMWLLGLIGVTDPGFFHRPEWWAQLGGIIWLDILLSGDNALVIGLVAAGLTPGQRQTAVLLGTAAAILLRVVSSIFISQLLLYSWVGIVGSIALVYIAVKMVLDLAESEHKPARSLLSAVGMIVVADITMSIDNMMAIAGLAHGDGSLIAIGLIVSIAIIISGATVISKTIAKYPWLAWVGAGFLGWIAGGIAAGDPAVKSWAEAHGERTVHYGASAAGVILVLLLAVAVRAILAARSEKRELARQREAVATFPAGVSPLATAGDRVR